MIDQRLDVLTLARLVDDAYAPTLVPRIGPLVRLGAYVRDHADLIIACIEHAQRAADAGADAHAIIASIEAAPGAAAPEGYDNVSLD